MNGGLAFGAQVAGVQSKFLTSIWQYAVCQRSHLLNDLFANKLINGNGIKCIQMLSFVCGGDR